jgi:hypothetical protein
MISQPVHMIKADCIPDEDRWSRWLIQSKATAEIAGER